MKKSLFILLVLAAILLGAYYLYKQKNWAGMQNKPGMTEKIKTLISITSQEIREENYTGSKPVISGESMLANAAREYVENIIAEFEAQANIAVPQMRADFGADSPAASYSVDIGAGEAESEKTQSIIISIYVYTGGAHGSSSYKVLTASKKTGKLLSLSDVIKPEKEIEFLTLIKEKLNGWRPEGSDTPVLFTEDVANLSFESFANWSLDDQNLTLYFSQYEVGPGVLGAFAFPIPLAEITGLLLQ